MQDTTLRQGKRIYRGFSNSPNFKGATAVRPDDAFKDLARRNDLRPAALRRLNGRRK
jgi:hypothetical protein